MEIILSEQVRSLTGSLGKGFGYSIQKRKNGFFSKRNSNGIVPPDGHWRFIVACAELASMGLHVANIKIDSQELSSALYSGKHFVAAEQVKANANANANAKRSYNARDILNLKRTFGL